MISVTLVQCSESVLDGLDNSAGSVFLSSPSVQHMGSDSASSSSSGQQARRSNIGLVNTHPNMNGTFRQSRIV
jgi:hypothetical protein